MFKTEYRNGVYQGQMTDGKRNGLGVFIWDNGNAYFGEWFNNDAEGEGFVSIPRVGVIQAHFRRNKMHGSSYFVGRNGTLRFAPYQYGRLDGRSVSITLNQDVQLANYSKGQLIETSVTPDVEEVEVLMDTILSSISSIDEIVERNPIQGGQGGFGYLEFPNKQTYIGCVSGTTPIGLGLMSSLLNKFTKDAQSTNDSQDMWAGCYVGGVLEGLCSHYKANGDVYCGMMEQSRMHGSGLFWIEDQKKWYLGHFQSNRCEKILKASEGSFEDFTLDALKFGLAVHGKADCNEKVKFPYQMEESEGRPSLTDRDFNDTKNDSNSVVSTHSIRKPTKYENLFSRQITSKENKPTFSKATCSSRGKQRGRNPSKVVRPCQDDRMSLSKMLEQSQPKIGTPSNTPQPDVTNLQKRLYELIISSTPNIYVDDQSATKQVPPAVKTFCEVATTTVEIEPLQPPKVLDKIAEHPDEHIEPSRKTSQLTTQTPHMALSQFHPQPPVMQQNSQVLCRSQSSRTIPKMNQQRQPIHQPAFSPYMMHRSPTLVRMPHTSHSPPAMRFAPPQVMTNCSPPPGVRYLQRVSSPNEVQFNPFKQMPHFAQKLLPHQIDQINNRRFFI